MELRSTVIVAPLLLAAAVVAHAQEGPAQLLTVGSRVRMRSTAIAGQPQGVVVSVDESTLTLVSSEGGLPLKVPVASLTSVETSLGRHRHIWQGAVAGVAAGVLFGLAMPVDSSPSCTPDSADFCSRGEAVAGGVFIFGAIGALAGSAIHGDHWVAVSLNPGPRARNGRPSFGIAVAARF